MRTANGYLDLLGVDSEGRLVVFELKREKLRREAVAQAVDYASWLDSLEDVELHRLIGENSGQRGIAEIGNFEEWYDDRWESLEALRPVRIVLVGLGADEPARRMADWLAAKSVDIDLLTFLGFRLGDRMLLARQLESGDEARKQGRRARNASRRAAESRREDIESKVDEYGMRDWWQDAVDVLRLNSRDAYRAKMMITFDKYKKRTLSTGVLATASHTIKIVEPGVALLTFLPPAVDLCLGEFERLRQAIPFNLEPPGRWFTTEHVKELWSCRLDESQWREHRESIAELVGLVDERWREAAEQPLP